MLNGYTTPLSPSARSVLVPPPPWHFSGDVIMVEFLLDPETIRQYLPAGLDVDPENPRAAAIAGEWQSCTTSGAELLDPNRSQYREFYIALAARHGEKFVVRCPFCWVDRDFSLVRGLVQGYPKKLGTIGMTRAYSTGLAAAAVAVGQTYAGTLTAADRRIAEITVTLDGQTPDAPDLMVAPLVHTRIFPGWAPGGGSVTELVTGGSVNQQVTNVWRGSGTVEFFPSPVDELDLLRPVAILAGYRFSFAETITGGQLLSCAGR